MTLRWCVELMSDRTVIDSFWLSLPGIGVDIVRHRHGTCRIVLVRRRFAGRGAIRATLYTPMIVPEIVSAVALLVLFAYIGLPRGWPTLMIGHALLLLPYRVRVSSQPTVSTGPVDEAANLGARPWRSFAEVVLPLLAPAVIRRRYWHHELQ